ncbi:MAG: tetratricopeptide repeat protein [Verrucomicrobia bacterium]|nr:tetratricopeptide repeat protein [Verrucomicrobiota bacterium]
MSVPKCSPSHFIGKEIEAFALLPKGGVQWLLRIPSWDFKWQDDYRFSKPIALPKGSLIKTRFRYDNSATNPRNPHHPPKRVTYGSLSEQEMCALRLQISPQNPAEVAELRRVLGQKKFAQDFAGFRFTVALDPNDARAHNNLGLCFHATRQTKLARQHLEEAVRLNPRYASAHYNLGVLLMDGREQTAAEDRFRKAIEISPDHSNALLNLGSILENRGALTEAEPLLVRSLAQFENPLARFNLGSVLLKRGAAKEARPHLELALASESLQPAVLQNLVICCAQLGDLDAALKHAERLTALQPRQSGAYNLLGFVHLKKGEPREAVASFERAVSLNPKDNQASANLQRARSALAEATETPSNPRP